jgi:hypothetical protein
MDAYIRIRFNDQITPQLLRMREDNEHEKNAWIFIQNPIMH